MSDLASFMPQGSTPSTASFTCNTCGIKFVAAEMQRKHMKTDWHRYNLKRRVAQLPSISSEVFAHKILQQQQLAKDQDQVDEFGFTIKTAKQIRDESRGRSLLKSLVESEVRSSSPASVISEFSQFSLGDTESIGDADSNFDTGSESNFTVRSSTDNESDFTTEEETDDATDSETESVDGAIEVKPITYCFYCGINNHEVEKNIRHMHNNHGLYIPERSYLEDLEGLLTFLNEVISIDNECLVCGFLGRSLESVRQHMESKGHCKIPYETDIEKEMIQEFYNFDVGTDRKSTSNKTVSFGEENQIMTQLATPGKASASGSKVLSTGLEVGHRSAFKYTHPPASLVRLSKDSQKAVALLDRRYAPGLTSRVVTKQEKQGRILEYRRKNIEIRRATQGKSNYIEHFRDEMLQ